MVETKDRLQLVLKLSAFGVLFARAIQHIFFDVPYRTLLWSEELFAPLFSYFDLSWKDYVTSQSTDLAINGLSYLAGAFLLFGSVVAVFSIKKLSKTLVLCSVYFVFLSFLYFIEKYSVIAQFIEYGSQVIAPFALFFYWKNGATKKLNLIIKIAVALTFIGHGSYALGIFQTPGNFIDMVVLILDCNETTAVYFLRVMGALDLVAAALLFIPIFSGWAFRFCFIWGLLTTFARIMESSSFGFTYVVAQSGHEFLMRFPHFLLPLYLLLNKKK